MTPATDHYQHLLWNTIYHNVLIALRQRVGDAPGLLEAERFVASAIRTALRRLDENLLTPMPTDELICWLVQVAHNKFIDAHRRAGTERRYQGVVYEGHERRELAQMEQTQHEEAASAAREEVSRLYDHATQEERIVLNGRMAGKSLVQIADEIAATVPERKGKCSQRTVGNLWQALCERWRNEAARSENRHE